VCCLVIPNGPGRTSQGTSAPGCTKLASDGYAHISLGAAQLVCSQLFTCLPKGLAFFHTFHLGWYFFPAIYHSYTEELSSNLKPAMLNSNVLSAACSVLWAGDFSCSCDVLHGGLWRKIFNFYNKFFFVLFIHKILKSLVIKTCALIRIEINRNLCMKKLHMKHLKKFPSFNSNLLYVPTH
jgi:hypothetical protein